MLILNFVQSLKKCIKKLVQKNVRKDKVSREVTINNITCDEKLSIVDELIMIKNKTQYCPYDHNILNYKLCNLRYYKDMRKNEIQGNLKMQVLHCSKCNRYFINENIQDNINKTIPIKKFVIKHRENYKKPDNKPQSANKSMQKTCNTCLHERSWECVGRKVICEDYKPCPQRKIPDYWPKEMEFRRNRYDR